MKMTKNCESSYARVVIQYRILAETLNCYKHESLLLKWILYILKIKHRTAWRNAKSVALFYHSIPDLLKPYIKIANMSSENNTHQLIQMDSKMMKFYSDTKNEKRHEKWTENDVCASTW